MTGGESSARSGKGSLGPTAYKLRFRGQDLWLVPGEFLIGRSSADIVIASTMVSRRHALVHVAPDTAQIQDLGSANGVYVNGERLSRSARALVDGDRIVIGGEELLFNVVRPAYEDTAALEVTVSSHDPIVPQRDDDEPDSRFPTHRVESLDLLGPIADKALAMGRATDAERLLSEHLTAILGDARAGRPVLPHVLEKASKYAISLAQTNAKGAWFDFVIGLHDAQRSPLSDRFVVEMQVALARVDAVDGQRLDRYLANLITLLPHFDSEQKRLVQRVEELVELAARKRKA